MADLKTPVGILVSGVELHVKDPNLAATKLFGNYQRVPGTGAITLPDEAASPTSIPGIDGVVQASGFSDVGSITVPLPQVGQHTTHRFLHVKRRDKGVVFARIIRRATIVFSGDAPFDVSTGVAAAADGVSVVTLTDAAGVAFVNKVRAGMVCAFKAPTDPPTFKDFGTVALTGTSKDFQLIHSIEVTDAGVLTSFKVAPGSTVLAAQPLYVRNPGVEWNDIECTVGQMGDGDFQQSSILGGNLVLIPSAELPVSTVVVSV